MAQQAALGLPDGVAIEVHQERIEIGAGYVKDDAWHHVDGHGHEHRYVGGKTPTLTTAWGEEVWCDSCGEYERESWLVCIECGETVEPGLVWRERTTIPGMRSVIIQRVTVRSRGYEVTERWCPSEEPDGNDLARWIARWIAEHQPDEESARLFPG